MTKLYALDGAVFDSIPVSADRVGHDGMCHDCGKPVGSDHIGGCGVERCPRCGGQMISCDCNDDLSSWCEWEEIVALVRVLMEVLEKGD